MLLRGSVDDLDLRILGEISAGLDESPIPYQVDLSIFDRIDHDGLREHIERVEVAFYQRERCYRPVGNRTVKVEPSPGWLVR